MTYRKATLNDLKGIRHVLSTTYHATNFNLRPETIAQVKEKWHSTEFLSKQILNEKLFFPVALYGDKVAGIATSGMRGEGTVDLFRFYVLSEYQGQGVGTRLIEMVKEHYPKAERIQAYVEEHNVSGLAYYERRGFKKLKQEQETSFGEVLTEWLMEKNLNR